MAEKHTSQIIKQIIKEFWLPILVAIIWTVITLNSLKVDEKDSLALKLAEKFGATFFFLSWLLAQYWRVNKQLEVKQNFSTVEERISTLTKDLEDKTKDLIGHLTGGDSYFYYKIGTQSGPDNWFMIDCIFVGNYTLTNNRIFFFSKNSNLKDHEMLIPSLNGKLAHKASQQMKIELSGSRITLSTIVFEAIGKQWIQIFDIQKNGAKLKVHSRVHIFATGEDIEDTYEIDYKEPSDWN